MKVGEKSTEDPLMTEEMKAWIAEQPGRTSVHIFESVERMLAAYAEAHNRPLSSETGQTGQV